MIDPSSSEEESDEEQVGVSSLPINFQEQKYTSENNKRTYLLNAKKKDQTE